MADITSELASQVAISEETARKGMGIVLELLKHKLPEESFAKVTAAVPDAESMMSAAETGDHSTGVVGAVKDALGHIFGNGSTEALLAKFGQLGLTAEQIQAFIPKVMEFLKGKLPDNVVNQISGLLPTTQEAAP